MFCHFIIHCQFEHDLSHTRANGSPSEEPDSALSDDPIVHRNGPVWSSHDSGSRACSGGVGSCSYWHRWWIGITQSYWHPCSPHETIPYKKGQGLKVGHWLAVNGDSLAHFPGSSFQFQFLYGTVLRGLNGCQQDCVVVYASRSQLNQLSSNENRISEAIIARTAQGIRGVSMGRVIAIAPLIPIKED